MNEWVSLLLHSQRDSITTAEDQINYLITSQQSLTAYQKPASGSSKNVKMRLWNMARLLQIHHRQLWIRVLDMMRMLEMSFMLIWMESERPPSLLARKFCHRLSQLTTVLALTLQLRYSISTHNIHYRWFDYIVGSKTSLNEPSVDYNKQRRSCRLSCDLRDVSHRSSYLFLQKRRLELDRLLLLWFHTEERVTCEMNSLGLWCCGWDWWQFAWTRRTLLLFRRRKA